MANIYSQNISSAPQGESINDIRRVFNFGERVAELNPAASPFFAYLSKVAKKPTDDPVFKFLEKRHQWQRRNFFVDGNVTLIDSSTAYAADSDLDLASVNFDVDYDRTGRKTGVGAKVEFATPLQTFVVKGVFNDGGTDKDILLYYRIKPASENGVVQGTNETAIKATFLKALYVATATQADGNSDVVETQTAGAVTLSDIGTADTVKLVDDAPAQIIGSAHAEGSDAPDGWRDEFYSREGYTQIFKTSVPLFSGSTLATRYRGDANEYMRVYQEKLMEHKMDIENALLFGYGSADESAAAGPVRKTWGILPYTEIYGNVKQFTYASSGYDTFVDAMSDIFDPESAAGGNKLVLASRDIMNWLNKLGGQSFLGNTMALNSGYRSSLDKNAGMFNGVPVTTVDTMYGTLNFVMEPLLRGPWANHAIAIDLANVAYRPLAGNGESRDTQIITNVQDNDIDGRKDMILTESGLEISLPETHAVLKFN